MTVDRSQARPRFPARAVVTAGMPYGNKDLHFGHVGGVFVHADFYARFLRDRIGPENVLFVSGTDCYGSPIQENWRQAVAAGKFDGTIEDFVERNHRSQAQTLAAYHVAIDWFGASSFGRSAEIHAQVSAFFFETLRAHGHLERVTLPQFYDPEADCFLNGRQVVGRCPIQGCQSERGYADECALGHQYMPADLLSPRSQLSGKTPEMREASNWYLALPKFREALEAWAERTEQEAGHRKFVTSAIREFFSLPIIHVLQKHLDELDAVAGRLPPHTREETGRSKSVQLVFADLGRREVACQVLAESGIQYRTSKTLVPFRLTGNAEWGLPLASDAPGTEGLTFWVWPESLWAPISFTQAALEARGGDPEGWRDWWCDPASQVTQFIGEDNIFFYGVAEPAMFMGMQGESFRSDPGPGLLQLPRLVANNHLLFLDKKASSSGKIRPPMAAKLLDHYTADQLRAHFSSLNLGKRSVGFRPKPLDPAARENTGDPVLKEGNLLSNVLNRAVRSCFYTLQEYFDGRLPVAPISDDVIALCETAILDFERFVHRFEFHSAMAVADRLIREITKRWSRNMRAAADADDLAQRAQTLVDGFHMVRVAVVLMHPVAPEGCAKVQRYLNVGDEFFAWDRIFEPLYAFMADPETHGFEFLEPRVDFFEKHPSQVSPSAEP